MKSTVLLAIAALVIMLSGCNFDTPQEIAIKNGYTHIIKTGVETNREWSKTVFAKNIKQDGACVEGDMISSDDIMSYNARAMRMKICKYEMLYRFH